MRRQKCQTDSNVKLSMRRIYCVSYYKVIFLKTLRFFPKKEVVLGFYCNNHEERENTHSVSSFSNSYSVVRILSSLLPNREASSLQMCESL